MTLILVTDGGVGYGPYSLQNLLGSQPTDLRLPILFPLSISVACIGDENTESDVSSCKAAYQTLFSKLGLPSADCSFHRVEESLSIKSTEAMFKEIAGRHYNQWIGTLEMGPEMTTQIQVKFVFLVGGWVGGWVAGIFILAQFQYTHCEHCWI